MYVGAGLVGQGAELIDVSNRVNAAQQRKRIRDTKAEFERIDSLIVPFEFACDTISKSLLLVNGFHQQNRGKWRRKRVEQ